MKYAGVVASSSKPASSATPTCHSTEASTGSVI